VSGSATPPSFPRRCATHAARGRIRQAARPAQRTTRVFHRRRRRPLDRRDRARDHGQPLLAAHRRRDHLRRGGGWFDHVRPPAVDRFRPRHARAGPDRVAVCSPRGRRARAVRARLRAQVHRVAAGISRRSPRATAPATAFLEAFDFAQAPRPPITLRSLPGLGRSPALYLPTMTTEAWYEGVTATLLAESPFRRSDYFKRFASER